MFMLLLQISYQHFQFLIEMDNSEEELSVDQPLPTPEENVHAEDPGSNIINEESLMKKMIKESRHSMIKITCYV